MEIAEHHTETLELVNIKLLPRSMEFDAILIHLLHNTDTSMLCRLFDDRKYMYIYLPIHQEYGYFH